VTVQTYSLMNGRLWPSTLFDCPSKNEKLEAPVEYLNGVRVCAAFTPPMVVDKVSRSPEHR
jgi:hypothetical protein